VYLLNEKKTEFHSVQRHEVPKIRDFWLIIIGWGESGKAIFRLALQFFGCCRNIFRARMA